MSPSSGLQVTIFLKGVKPYVCCTAQSICLSMYTGSIHANLQVSTCICIMYVQYIRYYAMLHILLAASLYLSLTRRHGFEGSQKNSNFACEKPHHSKHKVFRCY